MDADTRWDEGQRAAEARRGAAAVIAADNAEIAEDCNGYLGQPHDPESNRHRDAWCGRCGERLILTGYAGALEYIP